MRWAHSIEISGRCTFDLGQLQYQYPEERDDPALTAQDTLASAMPIGSADAKTKPVSNGIMPFTLPDDSGEVIREEVEKKISRGVRGHHPLAFDKKEIEEKIKAISKD